MGPAISRLRATLAANTVPPTTTTTTTPTTTTTRPITLTEQQRTQIIQTINNIDNIIIPFIEDAEYMIADINTAPGTDSLLTNLNNAFTSINEQLNTILPLINNTSNSVEKATIIQFFNIINDSNKNTSVLSNTKVGDRITFLLSCFLDIKTKIDLYYKKNITTNLDVQMLRKINIRFMNPPTPTLPTTSPSTTSSNLAEFFENTDNKNIKLFLLMLLIIIIILLLFHKCEM
jgi:hypothetical protein